jgi:hypothetical protein
MLHQREQQRFPPITKPHRFKLLQDVTQQPYRVEKSILIKILTIKINFYLDWYGSLLSK